MIAVSWCTHTPLGVLLVVIVAALSSIAECRGRGCEGRASPTRGTKRMFAADHRHYCDRSSTFGMNPNRKGIERIPRGGGDDNTTIGENGSGTVDSDNDVLVVETSSSSSGFEIIDEKTVYSGWRTILNRKVRMRNGKVVDFDLVGVKTGEGAVLVFAWDTKSKTATMIREYMPASHKVLWGIAAGLIEDKHQHDSELAARHELEEECHLKGGKWIPLLTQPAAMDKYATTTIQCYLVIDPVPEENPKPLDDEEDIEIVSGVTIPEILEYIQNGEMNLVGGYGSLLAIQKLQELGEYP